MMFNFENWSEKVFELTEYAFADKASDLAAQYREQYEQLWNELLLQEHDASVQFLRILLHQTKDLMDGKVDDANFQQIIEELRDTTLERLS
jgi:hypothetical protein